MILLLFSNQGYNSTERVYEEAGHPHSDCKFIPGGKEGGKEAVNLLR